ncbi:MAG: murein L,D-transpeptidase catalytic domain family protein [Sphingomicrobium sp.]
MSLNRREILRLGAAGAGGLLFSTAASSVGLPLTPNGDPSSPVPGFPATPVGPSAPAGVDPALFQRAKAALDLHRDRVRYRDTIGIVDFSLASAEPRFHVVDLISGRVDSFRVAHGKGSDMGHTGFLEQFSNRPGSEATSNGAYSTGDTYQGKYGLSMKVDGLDWSNNNANSRAIVIHNAWYAEDDVVAQHGKLGRSQGCFAFSKTNQWKVMQRLYGGRMIYADKLA